jgi:hypothetical protein
MFAPQAAAAMAWADTSPLVIFANKGEDPIPTESATDGVTH